VDGKGTSAWLGCTHSHQPGPHTCQPAGHPARARLTAPHTLRTAPLRGACAAGTRQETPNPAGVRTAVALLVREIQRADEYRTNGAAAARCIPHGEGPASCHHAEKIRDPQHSCCARWRSGHRSTDGRRPRRAAPALHRAGDRPRVLVVCTPTARAPTNWMPAPRDARCAPWVHPKVRAPDDTRPTAWCIGVALSLAPAPIGLTRPSSSAAALVPPSTT
jgi:hypothetical protein